jgi:uncharacterized membrane protein
VKSFFTAAFASFSYSGPLPPPSQLREYEDVLPGAADRIIRMAETQAEHRQDIEKVAVKGGNRRSWWGLWTGFVICIVVLGLSTAIILSGYQVAGTVLGGIDLVALASVFVIGRADQRRERIQKNEASQLPVQPRPQITGGAKKAPAKAKRRRR